MNRRDIHILLVDDEPMIRETFEFNLKEMGYQVSVADSGNQAVQLLKTKKISIIVSDVNMPNGNGLKLRDRLSDKDPPIIVMTAYQNAYHANLETETILEKPISLEKLDEVILDRLQTHQAKQAS